MTRFTFLACLGMLLALTHASGQWQRERGLGANHPATRTISWGYRGENAGRDAAPPTTEGRESNLVTRENLRTIVSAAIADAGPGSLPATSGGDSAPLPAALPAAMTVAQFEQLRRWFPDLSEPLLYDLAERMVNLATDPFQRTAVRALSGEWGALPDWKREAYARGLLAGVTVRGKVFLTAYYPWEGRDGRIDSRGNPCTPRTAAANLIPRGSYVWIENPCQMRQVLDCGAKSNDRVARRRGCDLWVDLWMTRRMGTRVTRYAVVSP